MTNEPNASEWEQAVKQAMSGGYSPQWIDNRARELAAARVVQATKGELLPCPFCGSKDVILRPEDNDTWGHIRCTKCNALGPAYSESGAINDAWNTRTAARESEQDEAFLVTQHELIRLTKENAELRGRIEGAPTTSAYLSNDDPPGCCFTSVAMVPMDWDGKTVALVTL